MTEDTQLNRLIDMAISHLIFARFGRISARARRGILRTAARMFDEVAELLRQQAENDVLEPAERMVGRAYESE